MNKKGLTDAEVAVLQAKYGKNELSEAKKENFLVKILHIICEPMFLLLLAAATIYFLLGEPGDGIIMLVFVVGIISIDVVQEWKTDQTLAALKDLSEPKITVLRNGKKVEIQSRELVPGDIMYIYEGVKIPADGKVIECSGLRVDESSLTGESEGVWKSTKDNRPDSEYWRNDYCYQGTCVLQGTGTIEVAKTGARTEYGKIGDNLDQAETRKTPLQTQIDNLVKVCAVIAFVLFAAVAIITFFNLADHALGERIVESILAGITLAMAMIPEEFPVVLTVFLSVGAWRLAKKNSLVKKLPAVETLGAVTVLCVDKTGTITENQMKVHDVITKAEKKELAEIMGLCCEEETYDPMEQAMLHYAADLGLSRKKLFGGKKLRIYPFDNDTKMMGCAWRRGGEVILAAKGSPENILKHCELTHAQRNQVNDEIRALQDKGLRVIAIAKQAFDEDSALKHKLTDHQLQYVGIVGLVDPPRATVADDIKRCRAAGVRVVMITGDNGITAASIARQIGIDSDHIITGDMLNKMSDKELKKAVKDVSIFSRVIPEHKMRIVKAFQANGEIVAMTGDGVNDAPALKQAEIGIAMGKRGSEVSREAADLVLMDDNFRTIVETIEDGRRIYDNIRKAVGYIFVIHIPIAASSLLAPMLGIDPASLFLLPAHIVLLELIIDPTCSIVLERQPAESNIMQRPPRKVKSNILTRATLIKSVIQGLVMFAASFGAYYLLLSTDAILARTVGLMIIVFANLFLVMVNSSDYDYTIITVQKLLQDKLLWLIFGVMMAAVFVVLYTPLNSFLKLASLTAKQFLAAIGVAFVAVFWYEGVKLVKHLGK